MRVVTHRLPRYGVAVLTTAIASLLALLLSPLSLRVPFALFSAAVIVSSLEGGLRPGLLATALSTAALAVEYWLLPVAQAPENQGEVVPLLVMFVIVGLLSNYLGKQCWRAVHAVEWVHATLASIGDGLIFTDAEGHVTFMNPVAHALTGWEREEAAEKLLGHVGRAAEQESRHPAQTAVVRVLRGAGAAAVAEPALRVADNGAEQSVDARAAAIRDPEGSLLGAVLMLRDVTASRQAETDVRQREQQFRSLAACAPVGILQMDPDGRCVYTNCSCQLNGGFTAEESLGEGWARFLHPEDRARVVPAWAAAMQAGKEYACEFRFQTPQQNGRWVRLRSSPMYSDMGKLIGHAGILHDIADQKLAEEALRETRTLLSAVAEESTDALFVKNLDGRYLLTNSAGARMLGKAVKEIIGKDDSQLFAADAARQMREHDRQVLSSGQAQTWEQGERAPGCQRDYVSRKTPFRDGRGNVVGLISICREVTEEKRVREQLHASEQRFAAFVRQLEERTAESAQATAALERELQARLRAEERLRETEARLRTGEERLADLAKANALLQEAVQARDRTVPERTAELARIHASVQEERAARRHAEEALRENRARLQASEERTAELEKAQASLQAEMDNRGQAADLLREDKQFLETLTQSSADGIFAFDRHCRCTFWNPAMEQISGIEKGRVVGRVASEVFPSLKGNDQDRHIAGTLEGKAVRTRTGPFWLSTNGRPKSLEVSYAPLRTPSAEIVGGMAVVRERTKGRPAGGQTAEGSEKDAATERTPAAPESVPAQGQPAPEATGPGELRPQDVSDWLSFN